MCHLGYSIPSMDRLGCHDAIITARQFLDIAGGIWPGCKVSRTGKPQTVLADGLDVLLPYVVGPDFRLACLGQMCGKQAAHRPAANHTNPHPPTNPQSGVILSGLHPRRTLRTWKITVECSQMEQLARTDDP